MSQAKHDERAIRERAARHGQDHIFRFWDDLSGTERASLLEQAASIDFELMERLVRDHVKAPPESPPASLSPAPIVAAPAGDDARRAADRAAATGEQALRAGRVAAFLVAGGQGTRLGFDGPKGAYEIGPVTRRTLFQLHAEKIAALSRRSGKTVPWYIMTSESNHDATVAYFREHAFHGLREDSVRFFRQDMLPAVDRAGKFLLETKSRVFTSPNGHGGSLKALRDSGALADMKERGIDVIFYFQVDNPLVEICDPVFLGRHLEARADMSSKVVRKSSWKEKVGVIGLLGGKLAVIEYSDLPEAAARAVLPDGSLEYWAGSIAIHVLSADFVDRLTRGGFHLPYHRAEKAIPHVDASARVVKPSEKNGIKFETFVFDALAEARNSVTMEVLREEEFSPVKNAEGEDSPATSRRDLTALYLRWLEENGASIERDQGGAFPGYAEISPLAALRASDLAGKVRPGTVVRPGFLLKG